jgi:hypothetical protein
MEIQQPPQNKLPEQSSTRVSAGHQNMEPRLEMAAVSETAVRHYVPPLLDHQIKGILYSPLDG